MATYLSRREGLGLLSRALAPGLQPRAIREKLLSVKVTNVNPKTTAAPEGGYSHGVLVEGTHRQLFISGQIPESPDGEIPVGFEPQCLAVWSNIGQVLTETGMTFENVVKVTTYLTSPDFAETNGRIRRQILGDLRPALTVVIAQTLDSRWLLEIEAIAAAPA